MRKILAALALLAALVTPSHAEELRPDEGHSIVLNGVTGVAFYTIEGDVVQLVAVLAAGENGVPVRFESMLAPEQRLTISVPGLLGATAHAIEFVRRGDSVEIVEPDIALN